VCCGICFLLRALTCLPRLSPAEALRLTSPGVQGIPVGFGVSAMINKMKFSADYDRRIYIYDYMANFCASLTPTYQINRYNAVFLRATMVGHIRQAYNFDLMGGNDNQGFDGGFMIANIGYSFTPFQSMAGTRTIN
jgi:hypothetical protein